MNEKELRLSGSQGNPSITIPYCTSSNLPMGPIHQNQRAAYAGSTGSTLRTQRQSNVTIPSNVNLSEPEKEIMRWHQKLGHVSMKKIQWLMRQGLLSSTERARTLHSTASKLTHGPMCTACQYAKQRRKTTPGTTRKEIHRERHALKTNDLFPGSKISVDHFQCNPLGRLLTSFGKEKVNDKYKGGCIFVDHSSGYIHVELQVRLNTRETLEAKKEFEAECSKHGVIPQSYITDEGSSFTSDEFNSHLAQFKQTIKHTAPGGHHSNGIAERNIGTVMSISRAMMHHAAIHWPEVADVELWPLAVHHAVYILNMIPQESTGRSALELFSRKTWATSKFQDFHVWGSPAYVLDSTLAGGRQVPRWQPRSNRSVFVGNSIKQGHGVPLVLSLDTGKITSQYHVIVDNWFQTVEATTSNSIDFDHDDWYKTFGLTPWQYVPDNDDEPLPDNTPVANSEGATQLERARTVRAQPRDDPTETRTVSPTQGLTPPQATEEPRSPIKLRSRPPREPVYEREHSSQYFPARPAPSTLQRENDPTPKALPSQESTSVLPDKREEAPSTPALQRENRITQRYFKILAVAS